MAVVVVVSMMRCAWWLTCGLLLAVILAGCVTHRARDPRRDIEPGAHATARGPDGEHHALFGGASWYGERHHGRRTACGEPFDMNAFTAAHKTLPFHTIVRVTDPQTRKEVVVRINDRGPYGHGRVIDLSHAAADDLQMIRAGVIPVQLEVLSWGDGKRCT